MNNASAPAYQRVRPRRALFRVGECYRRPAASPEPLTTRIGDPWRGSSVGGEKRIAHEEPVGIPIGRIRTYHRESLGLADAGVDFRFEDWDGLEYKVAFNLHARSAITRRPLAHRLKQLPGLPSAFQF